MTNAMEIASADTLEGKRLGCPIEAALDVIGNRTSFLVLREAIYGTRRFDLFVERLGVTDAAAASHLRRLTDAGLLERVPYREDGQRTRYEYQLTEKGAELLPVLLALGQWTQRNLWTDRQRLDVFQTATGLPIDVRVCAGEGTSLTADEITVVRSG